MNILFNLILWCTAATSLHGVCFSSQEAALKTYDQFVEQLASAQNEGEYARAADLLINHINQLRTLFGSKNIAEMRGECDTTFATPMSEIAREFILGSLLPKNADPAIRTKALKLLQSLLATRIITLDSPKAATAVARVLFDIGLWEALELIYNPLVFVPKITNQDEQNALFEEIFLPLIMEYGPLFALKRPAAPRYEQFSRVVETLLEYHPNIKVLKDSAGKTALHRLFEKDMSRSVLQPKKNKSDQYLRELTSLKPLAGLKRVAVIRSIPSNAQVADWILTLGHAIKTAADRDANTFLHVLRKNNIFGAQDADVRDLLEQKFGDPHFTTGFSRAQFANILNAENKRYTDYPPLVNPALYQEYLGLYIAHALNQFAESLNALI